MPTRRPIDATLRNVRASHRRDRQLREKVTALTQRVSALERRLTKLGKALGVAVLLSLVFSSSAWAQSTATITAKTCTLTSPERATGPDGTATGWTYQAQRNGVSHGTRDTSAPFGPKSAVVDAGVYALAIVWTKGGKTTTEPVGTATCQGGTVSVEPVTPPPPPPAEACGDGVDNDKDGQIDEGCPTLPTGASPDGAAVPPEARITDSTGAVWSLGAELNGVPGVRYVTRNGQSTLTYGRSLLYIGGSVYLLAADDVWYRWDGQQWVRHGVTRPGGSTSQPPPVEARTESRTLVFDPDPSQYATLVSRFQLIVRAADGSVGADLDLGKPPLRSTGDVMLPVTLTLVPGRTYRVSVAACAATVCGVYSAESEFVF